jgi:glycosyltransferase involved in cell wall biosynthesis
MRQPLFTVLIDSFNYGHFIEEAVDSVLTQDFPADQIEIIVVDDGSTDDTAEHLKKYGNRIKYLYKNNGGQASAFNLGLSHAQGDLVALLDADDYFLPNKLRRLSEEFSKAPDAGMVYHRLQEFNSRTGVRIESSFVPISGFIAKDRNALLSYVLYPTSALAFRRSLLQPLLPVPESLTIQADSHLTGLIIFLAPIVAISESLAVYRVHGNNLFNVPGSGFDAKRTERRVATRQFLIDDMQQWLRSHGHNLQDPLLHELFMQWSLTQEADQFTLNSPGRWQLFVHLLRYNRYFRPRLSPRHLAMNYLQAFAAPVLGFNHLHLVEDVVKKLKKNT